MAQIKCGACEKIITPSLDKKYNMPGYPWRREATEVISDLLTNVIVLDNGEKKIAMVSLDAIGIGGRWVKEFRSTLVEKFGFDYDSILVTATHTHTGSPKPGGWSEEDKEYEQIIMSATIEAITEALENIRPVKVSYGVGEETRVSYNRIFKMNDGTYKSNPRGERIKDIVCPSAPIDYGVGVIRFDDENGKTIAQIVNYVNHADSVGLNAYCADWPGELRRVVKEKFGKDMVMLMFNGCCGNVGHVNLFLKEGEEQNNYIKVGQCLGETVLKINENMSPVDDTTLDYARRAEVFKRRQPTEADYEDAKKVLQDPEASQAKRRYANVIISFWEHPILTVVIELQSLRIGDCAIATLPCEAFADTGMKIKAESPFKRTLVSCLANDSCGYVASEPVYSANTYESKLSTSMYLSATDADTMAKMLNELMNGFLKK